jgi:RNA polymerase sigma-70 factor (ECF subfamily)
MTKTSREQISRILGEGPPGADSPAAAKLLPLVYDELRNMARRYFRNERRGHTLQPTALVHEAFLRLVDETRVDWNGQAHFRAVCARAMRQVLIDYARSRSRERRGGGQKRVILESMTAPLHLDAVDAVALDEALERLAALDARQARVVELRFFGGMSVDEVAKVLGISKRSAEGDWTHAKAWLKSEMSRELDE